MILKERVALNSPVKIHLLMKFFTFVLHNGHFLYTIKSVYKYEHLISCFLNSSIIMVSTAAFECHGQKFKTLQ